MNQSWILIHLREAKEELDRLIGRIEADPRYDCDAYKVAMAHLYHHLNTAWNARSASRQVVQEYSDEDFYRWRSFPTNEELQLNP